MKLYKIFRTISETAWALSCVAVLCTVFVVIPELWNGVVTGKYFWFFWTQTAFSGLTLLNVLLRKKNWSVSILDVFVLLFIGYCSVNYLTRDTGFEIKLYLLLFLGMFYICLRVFIQAIAGASWVLPAALITAGLVESVYGLTQLYGLSPSYHALYKITGHFFNPGPFSGFVAITVPLALYYVLSFWKEAGERLQEIRSPISIENKIFSERNIPLLLVCLSVLDLVAAALVIPTAMSRSAWLSIVAGVLVVLAIRYDLLPKGKRFFRKNKSRAILTLFAGVIIMGVAFAGAYNLKRGSADGRLFLWKIAIQAIAKEPVFGAGLGNFAGAYGQAQYDYFVRGIDEKEAMTADCPAYAFNEFLQIGVEQGIAGLLLFLGVLFLAVKGCLKDKRKAGILGAVIAILVFGFTSYPFSVLPICIGFVVLLALANEGGKAAPVSLGIILASFLFAFCVWFAFRAVNAADMYRYRKIVNELRLSGYGGIEKDYARLFPCMGNYGSFLFSYGKILATEKRYQEANQALLDGASRSSDPMFYNLIGNNYLAMGQIYKAEEYYFRAYYTLPNRLYPLYLLTKLYHETGQDEKAKAMAGKLLEKQPKVMSTAVREMKDYARNLKKRQDSPK